MIDEIQSLLDKYIDWLKSKNTLRQIDDWIEITTPYLDRHNDYLQMYVTKKKDGKDGEYILTDDGYIIEDLKQSGCSLDSPKRIALLHATLNGFGIRLGKGDALEVRASQNNFSLRKHNLIQAMLAVNDLFYLSESNIASIFKEDVIAWLDKNEIRYTPDVKFTGKSGYDHRFDFVIPANKSHNEPERILQTINRPNRGIASTLIFSWLDTKEVRPPNSRAYAIINDAEGVSPTVVESLENYDVKTVLWGYRQDVLPELTA